MIEYERMKTKSKGVSNRASFTLHSRENTLVDYRHPSAHHGMFFCHMSCRGIERYSG